MPYTMPDKDATSAAVIPGSGASAAVAEPLIDSGGTGPDHDPNRPSTVVEASPLEALPQGTSPSGSYRHPSSSRPVGAPPDGETPNVSGTLLGGKYRLEQCLSEGGMGTVWLAHHESLDAEVAVKILRRGLPDPTGAERFHREARAAAKLGHPAIVRVLDFGHSETGDPYIVMERLRGEDLRTRILRSARLHPIAAVRLLLPVAHAIAAAHEKGIVHRDIKPENIFLSVSEGTGIQPKLVDFGIATMASNASRSLTFDTVLGSPGYMSPEQARGENIDYRTDIWSFCIVLYEALVGSPPFVATNYNAVLREVIETDPTPLVSTLPDEAELWALLERGLAKNRRKRWPSMRVLGIELAQWLLARGITEDATNTSLQSTWMPAVRATDTPSDYVRTQQTPRSASTAGARSTREPAPTDTDRPVSTADASGSEAPVSTPALLPSGRSAVMWALAGGAAVSLVLTTAFWLIETSGEPGEPARLERPSAQTTGPAAARAPAQQPAEQHAVPEPSGTSSARLPSLPRAVVATQNADTGHPAAASTANQRDRPPSATRTVTPKRAATNPTAPVSPAPPTQGAPGGPDTDTDIKTTF